ncbi:hypothetical protein BD408DRAFT_414744 [Parasitella parasitica]|nr:hypothetical protein BD408DRAFT_414744 [Parasitella parasitica]
MSDSLFYKMFGSVRLVQEVTRSNQSSATNTATPNSAEESILTIEETSAPSNASDLTSDDIDPNNGILLETTQINEKIELEPEHKQEEQQQHTYIHQQHIHQRQPAFSAVQQQQQKTLPCWSTTPCHIPITFSAITSPNLQPCNKPSDFRNVFTASNTTQTNTAPSPAVKTHTRKNSKYTIRHHRTRQSSFNSTTNPPGHLFPGSLLRKQQPTHHHNFLQLQEEQQKSKSQKLLCLWPLPTVTRYMILVALIVSTLDCFHILDLSCSAPSFVVYRFDFKNMIFSPFLFDWTLPTMALFGWNVLILGLFEESLAHMVGGTRRFVQLLVFLFASVSLLRVCLGLLFSKSTGYAFPTLFFSNTMHECSQGLSPFLFALLVVQSLSIDDKYILIYGQEDSNHKLTVRKVTLQLFMCLVNYTNSNILWWSVSGLIMGLLSTITLQALLAWQKREDSSKVKDVSEFITLEHYRRTPLWRLLWSSVQKCFVVIGLTLPILMAWNSYYTRESMVSSAELNAISQDRYLFTFVFMTAPRRGDPAYLTRTIESYLENWPEHPSPSSPYNRMQAIIYTHFSNHSQYDLAKEHFSNTTKGQQYLKWIREEGVGWNQRLHVSKALDFATETYQSTYYALMEDDFPVCGAHEWHDIENVIYKAEKNAPHHCGIFVGTGGSGLFLKPDLARLASKLLLTYVDMPPDIIIQKCLMGDLTECSSCTDSLVTSKTLLMYHIGYNTSTSADRVYRKDEFQCGWRHPFNGNPSVITL